MLNLTLKELKSIAKNRNIDGYKSMPKDQLINPITTDKLSSTSRPAFKIEEYIDKISKSVLKDCLHCNYGYLTSRTKVEVYRVLNEIKLKCLKSM